jgi:4-amino-4-deoxy-L-arabinose transferase-like glycosyltransferase
VRVHFEWGRHPVTTVRHFGWWLALVTACGLCLRVVVIVTSRNEAVGGDGFAYWATANHNAGGHWFLSPFLGRATAIHPPVWTLILTVWAMLGQHTFYSMQLLAAIIGTATVAMVGLAGRRVSGDRVGLIAAGLAAAYAGFWVYERALLSETFLLLVIAVTLIVAYWFRDRPSLGGAALLGGLTGLLATTRSEQLLIFPLLVAPLIWSAKSLARRIRLAWLAIALAVTLVVVAPWTIYNLGRFQKPVFLSTQAGTAVSNGSCNGTYTGPRIGYYDLFCFPKPEPTDESNANGKNLHAGLTYAEHHLSRLPLVVFAREGRAFGYWNPFQQTMLDNAWQHVSPIFGETTSVWVYDLRLITYWILLIPAVVGAIALRRRRVPLYPLLAFVATVIITVALTFGETRYRAAAEVTLVILAAAGIDAALPSLRRPAAADDEALLTRNPALDQERGTRHEPLAPHT